MGVTQGETLSWGNRGRSFLLLEIRTRPTKGPKLQKEVVPHQDDEAVDTRISWLLMDNS